MKCFYIIGLEPEDCERSILYTVNSTELLPYFECKYLFMNEVKLYRKDLKL